MVSDKRITADFTGGDVIRDGGVLVLREIADRLGIVDQLAQAIKDTRHQSYVRHDSKDLFAQRIYQIDCGYEDSPTTRMTPRAERSN